jgi:hypothetical protein
MIVFEKHVFLFVVFKIPDFLFSAFSFSKSLFFCVALVVFKYNAFLFGIWRLVFSAFPVPRCVPDCVPVLPSTKNSRFQKLYLSALCFPASHFCIVFEK